MKKIWQKLTQTTTISITLIFLIGIAAATTGAIILKTQVGVNQPSHEELNLDFGTLDAGESTSKSTTAQLSLPGSKNYQVTWTLDGNLSKFSSVELRIENAVGESWILTKDNPSTTQTIETDGSFSYDLTIKTEATMQTGSSVVTTNEDLLITVSCQ